MLIIDENLEAERDLHGWKLYQYYKGYDKDGNDKRQSRTTYHANLRQVIMKAVDISAGRVETLAELNKIIDKLDKIELQSN